MANDFDRGYFCAVATLVRLHGATVEARDLLRNGGDKSHADPEDQALFIAEGLMTDPDASNRELAARVNEMVQAAAADATRATGLTLTEFARRYRK